MTDTMTADPLLTGTLDKLDAALRSPSGWSAQTSANPATWTADRPSTGQCAITALLVQRLHGGAIVRVTVPGDSHYFNLIDGHEVDLTRDQFDAYTPTCEPVERPRDYLTGNQHTAARYRELCNRLGLTPDC